MAPLRQLVIACLAIPSAALIVKGSPSPGCQLYSSLLQSEHLPKAPKDLKEYKNEAEGCLTFCGSLSDKCFKGCLDDCSKRLGPPQCVGFVLEKPCLDACKSLEPGYSCLATVTPKDTFECHAKFGKASIPDPAKQKCPLP